MAQTLRFDPTIKENLTPANLIEAQRRRGRGSLSRESGRFEPLHREELDDGWGTLETLVALKTNAHIEKPRSLITKNDSPDIRFDRSINPYRGCEHGCIYCFARPTHAYVGLSPGLDFETEIFVKEGAAQLLERELSAQNYTPKIIAIGSNTDPYQPIEKRHRIMRSILEVLSRANHPVGIVTKSALILRDLDLLAPMAQKGLVKVAISLTTLDPQLARLMEPRAAAPTQRLIVIEKLAAAGIPVTVTPVNFSQQDIKIQLVLLPGFLVSSVSQSVIDVVTLYFSTLSIGDGFDIPVLSKTSTNSAGSVESSYKVLLVDTNGNSGFPSDSLTITSAAPTSANPIVVTWTKPSSGPNIYSAQLLKWNNESWKLLYTKIYTGNETGQYSDDGSQDSILDAKSTYNFSNPPRKVFQKSALLQSIMRIAGIAAATIKAPHPTNTLIPDQEVIIPPKGFVLKLGICEVR